MASNCLWLSRLVLLHRVFCGSLLRAMTIVTIGIAFSACVTPYQKAGFSGGYTDFETQPEVYYVSFKGNGYTSKETVVQYWHRRAAEICGGRERYEIVSQDASTTQYIAGSRGQIDTAHKARAEGYIKCKKQ